MLYLVLINIQTPCETVNYYLNELYSLYIFPLAAGTFQSWTFSKERVGDFFFCISTSPAPVLSTGYIGK